MTEANDKSSWLVMMNALADEVMPKFSIAFEKALEQADEALFSTAAGANKPEPFQNAIAEIRVGKQNFVNQLNKEIRAEIPVWLEKKNKNNSGLTLIADDEASLSFGAAEMAAKFRSASHSWSLFFNVIGPTNTSKNASEAPFQPDGLARALSRVSSSISKNPEVRTVIDKTFERVISNYIHDLTADMQKVMEKHGWIRVKQDSGRKFSEKDVFNEVASGLKGLKFNLGSRGAGKKDWSAAVSAGRSSNTQTETPQGPEQYYEPVNKTPTAPTGQSYNKEYAKYEPRSEGWVGAISNALNNFFGIFKGDEVSVAGGEVDDYAGNLVDLLSKRREAPQKVLRTGRSGTSGPQTEYVSRDVGGALIIPGDVLDSVLIESQKRLPAGIRACVHRPDRSLAQQIKYNIIRQAESFRPDLAGGILGGSDDDAIDVVGMMFEVFISERNLERNIKEEIARLSIPYIRLARTDRKLFMQRTHPARLLLNILAEAGEGNTGEHPADLDLLEHCKKAIDSVCTNFDGISSNVFIEAEAYLRAGLDEHKKKTSVIEQKTVEVQMDKDRLEKARELAVEAFDAQTMDWSADLKNIIGPYWQTYRTSLLARDGSILEQSQSDGLLMMISVCKGSHVGDDDREAYDYIIENMLASSGITGVGVSSIKDSIWSAVESKSAGGAETGSDLLDDIDNLLGGIGGGQEVVKQERYDEDRVIEFSEDEKSSLKSYFEKMAVGTWLDFISSDGSLKAGKLSWISPISMKLMFVNRKGARISVESIDDLVTKVLKGSIKLRTDDPAFDRSLKQAITRLESELEAIDKVS